MHPLQPLLHSNLWIVAQQLPGLFDAGEAVGYIAIPIRAVLGIDGAIGNVPDVLPQGIQIGAFATGYVVHLIQGFFLIGKEGAEVGLYGIVHVGKIPAVGTIAVDGGRFLVQGGLEKQGDHGRVGSVRILARAEYIEIAQSYVVDAVCFRKNIGVEFVHVLGHGVGRQRLPDGVLDLGQGLMVSVGTAGGGKDDPGYLLLHRRLKYLQGTGNIHSIGSQGILQAAGHGAQGGLVADAIHACAGLPAGVEIADVALNKSTAGIGQKGLDIGPLPSGQVIKDSHVGDALILQEGFHQVGADEARTAGDEDLQCGCIW